MRTTICLITMAGLLSLSSPTAWAEAGPELEVLRGQVRVRQASGDWETSVKHLSQGSELETGPDGCAVVALPDAGRIRLAPSTRLRLGSSGPSLALELSRGSIFAQLQSPAVVQGPTSEVRASAGVFVYDVSGPRDSLRVVEGNARLVASEVTLSLLPGLASPGSLEVPAGLQGLAGELLGPVAAAETPSDPSGFGPVESMGQDEQRQDARQLLGGAPGLNPLVILGGLLAGGGLIGLLAGGGSGGSGGAGGGGTDGGATGVPASP